MDKETAVLLQAVEQAGAAILKLQHSGFSVERKSNNSLLTQADLLANDILKTQLTDAFPAYGWLSEESVDEIKRLECERVWVVDPIDGTKEFVEGLPEYAISVALVEKGLPILACIFNPASNEFFHAVKGQGAYLQRQRIQCQKVSGRRLVLLASRSEYERGEWDAFEKDHEVKQIGSIAYKLALVAAGKAHATFSLGPKHEWDIAAGALLVTEAGGEATDLDLNAFVFNQPKVKVNGIIAGSLTVNQQIVAMARN